MEIQLTPEQQKRADTLSHMTPKEWDSICKQCGICCLGKVGMPITDNPVSDDDIKIIYLKHCCENFDKKTRKCSIYQTRFKNPNCEKVDMNIILKSKILPSSCGYVEYIFGPAKVPAKVNFSKLRPVPYNEEITMDQVVKDAIPGSFLWNERDR